eukprot:GHVO01021406.1.p1 GENE.GHVO01021406.1~~GHVO01021406.1.p1  ORF type:complete len:140 (+),score=13.19 GHVO01021406.1:133-552(+)
METDQPSEERLPLSWQCHGCRRRHPQLNQLPCSHVFCDRCFYQWVGIYIDMYRNNGGRFPCQVCWHLYEIPFNGLSAFKQDMQVLELEAQFGRVSMQQQVETTSPAACSTPESSPPQLDSQDAGFKYCYRSRQLHEHMI